MTALEELDVPRPRPDELAASVVRRLDPWWGWAIAGALLALGGLVVGTLALITIAEPLGVADGTLAAQVMTPLCLALGLGAACLVFVRWRRHRVAGKRALVRDGALARATVTDRWRTVKKGRSDVELAVAGGPVLACVFNVWFGPAPGREVRVLWMRDCPTILAFDDAGRMYSGHVDGVAAPGR